MNSKDQKPKSYLGSPILGLGVGLVPLHSNHSKTLSSSSEVNWYSFQHRNLHITAVCTYCDISEDSAQYKWLEKDLAAAANNSKCNNHLVPQNRCRTKT